MVTIKLNLKLFVIFIFLLNSIGCSNTQVRFAAIGDTPYFESDSELLVITEALNNIYSEGLPFVVHVGDIIRGRTSCSEALFQMRADVFSQSPIPFLITIGDNEFVDCQDPIKARSQFRNIILKNPSTKEIVTGTAIDSGSLLVTRQREMIENAAWRYNGVDFIMLVLPELPGVYRLEPSVLDEIFNLNVKFLVKHFNQAIKNNSHAVVLIMHSNPIVCRLKRCLKFNEKIKDEVKKFAKPVLFLNGDIHNKEFEGPGYMGLHNLWHLRPGNKPEESWPEIIYFKEEKIFSVKWHNTVVE